MVLKKNTVKVVLIAVTVILVGYLIGVHFSIMGSHTIAIEPYNLSTDIKTDIDNLPGSWSSSYYAKINKVIVDIDVADKMEGITGSEAETRFTEAKTGFNKVALSYFKQSVWNPASIEEIHSVAKYFNAGAILEYVAGYYQARDAIACSRSCYTQSAVVNCIRDADKYNRAPWANCSDIQTGLTSVKPNALSSYAQTLLPVCNKLSRYRSAYSYFEDFDADYQRVKTALEFLNRYGYKDSALNWAFSNIEYQDAANMLDVKL